MYRFLSLCIGSFAFATSAGCDPGASSPNFEPKGMAAPEQQIQCPAKQIRIGKECFVPPDIKLNTVGYLIGRVKRATVPAVEGVEAFRIASATTGEVVHEGMLAPAIDNADTADRTRIADFSVLETPGTYVLEVDGLSVSPPFDIGDNVLNEPLRVTMLGMYGLRCGVAVTIEHQGQTFGHGACHVLDATRGDAVVDGTGGWHDAGDYGKYTVNAAFALAFTLKAWEDFGVGLGSIQHIPNHDGALPAWLAESKFQLDQILKMQLSDGGAAHMIGPYNPSGPAPYPGEVLPERDTYQRAFSDVGTAATADLAAVAAMAARVYRSFDPAYADKCLAAAQLAQAYLDQNPSFKSPDLASHFTHNAYATRDDTDDRFWALAELWRATLDPAILARIEATAATSVKTDFDWSGVQNLGLYSYVQAQSDARNPTILEQAKAAITRAADQLVTTTSEHAYGRGIGSSYWWGSNGTVARATINLFVAHSLAPDPKYLDAAIQQVDFLLGRNAFGRSFVTGVGYLPALKPHHRPSQADSTQAPWPGLLVGGPNSRGDDPVLVKGVESGLAPGLMWFDQYASYGSNEVAINWNTALAYALAGFYK